MISCAQVGRRNFRTDARRVPYSRREAGGWIFCRAHDIYFGVWTSTPGEWHRESSPDRLTIVHPRTAIVPEAVAAIDTGSFDAFCADRLAHTPTFDETTLTATYTTTRGDRLQFIHRGPRLVSDQPVDLTTWPLFEGPGLNAARHTGVITFQSGPERVVLDFKTVKVTPEATP